MESKEEGSVLNSIKIESIEATRKVECADERTLVRKKCSLYKINGLCIFFPRIERRHANDKKKRKGKPTHLLDADRPLKVEATYPPAMVVSVTAHKIPVGLEAQVISSMTFW